ncbi:hypothetical protein B0A50_02279 [Salinomyces thailandicus]|uniref:Mid2 domain-containing protein n=1 Tax=Salinomyces thailandicus TaxID=706561 RepID=A0A4U0U9T2_9PEZI|nr:hypothetical protein B0A50_02279 [Salinomyces thailandica]
MRWPSSTTTTTPAALAIFTLHALHSAAQNCYYPNGDLADGMAACSSDGGACCPYQWACLSNGLCYLENADYYGRYTCTDQGWSNSTCPDLCTQGDTASGNEAILQCADGSWCCDGDRSFDCCEQSDTEGFSLPKGSQVAFISSVGSATSAPSAISTSHTSISQTSDTASTWSLPVSSTVSSASSTEPLSSTTSISAATSSSSTSSSATTSLSSTSEAPSTITSSAVTTGTNGVTSTIIMFSTITPTPTPINAVSSNNAKASTPHLSLIIGIATGIPAAILACSFLTYLLFRRRRRTRLATLTPNHNDDYNQAAINEKFGHQVGHAPPDGRAPELDSYPVATQRHASGCKSELEGSSTVNNSPAMSSSAGTAPPRYEQGSSPFLSSPGLQSVREEGRLEPEPEPQELWGGYVPYRPPQPPSLLQGEAQGDGQVEGGRGGGKTA